MPEFRSVKKTVRRDADFLARAKWIPDSKAIPSVELSSMELPKKLGAAAASMGDRDEDYLFMDLPTGAKLKDAVWRKKMADLAAEEDAIRHGNKNSSDSKIGGEAGGSSRPGAYRPPGARGMDSGLSGLPESPEQETRTLRVNNLSDSCTDRDLANLFSSFGRVLHAVCPRNPETQLPRGFGFVTFSRREEAEAALSKLQNHGFDNLLLRLSWAEDKKPMGARPLGPGGDRPGGDRPGGDRPYGGDRMGGARPPFRG